MAAVAGPAAVGDGASLAHDSGLEIETRSQSTYARRRFMRHRLAVASLFVLLTILLAGAGASWVAPYPYDGIDLENAGVRHVRSTAGTSSARTLLGRDYFSRVIYGIQTSEKVAFIVAIVAVLLGTIVGAAFGLLLGLGGQRPHALHGPHPHLARPRGAPDRGGLPRARVALSGRAHPRIPALGHRWPGSCAASSSPCARRTTSTPPRPPGAGDLRIIFRHMLPNSLGPIIVFATLQIGIAILPRGRSLVPRVRNPASDARARAADRPGEQGRLDGPLVAPPAVPRGSRSCSSCCASAS